MAADVRRGRLAGAPLLDPGLRRRLLIALPGIRHLGYAVREVAAILVEEMQDAGASGGWPSATWLADTHRPVAKLP